jgi:hypothetical protein
MVRFDKSVKILTKQTFRTKFYTNYRTNIRRWQFGKQSEGGRRIICPTLPKSKRKKQIKLLIYHHGSIITS